MENFDTFVSAVRTTLEPEARANATANTLEQLSQYIPDSVSLSNLSAAWMQLSSGNTSDPRVTSRRATCGELGAIAAEIAGSGDARAAIPAWQAWHDTFASSDDPRQKAMAATFGRELAELEA